MRKWECIVCGWLYDESVGYPEGNIPPGTRWEDIPEDFLCPECGVGKEDFELIEDGSQPAVTSEGTTDPIIIIGTGLAGYNLAREIRKHDTTTPLQLITGDDGRFYSKPMLSTGFTRAMTADDLATATAGEMAEQLKAEVLIMTSVQAIDSDAHIVETDDGMRRKYSKLVLAWGAAVIEPPLRGNGLDFVCSVNSLMDYARFRRLLSESQISRILIIGAGLIGSEFANDLANGGYQLEAVEPLAWTLPMLLPEQAGTAVQEALEELGVNYHFGTVIDRIDCADGGGVVATLANGETVAADLVVSAVGVRPRLELAERSGLKVNRGIVVNRMLETSARDIYALGDCAEVEGLVLYYVAPLMACARVLAKTLTGTPTAVSYPGMPVTIKIPACPVVVSPPARDSQGEWQISRDGRNVVAEFRAATGQLLGFALTGEGTRQKLQLQKQLLPLLD